MSKLKIKILCFQCGIVFYSVCDISNILEQCPRCYNG